MQQECKGAGAVVAAEERWYVDLGFWAFTV